jgi:hypothetical protein
MFLEFNSICTDVELNYLYYMRTYVSETSETTDETTRCQNQKTAIRTVCCSCRWGETLYVSELRPPKGQLFIPQMIYESGQPEWNDTGMQNRRTRGKTCPSATVSNTNPTWTEPGANRGLRAQGPATNRPNHGSDKGQSVGCTFQNDKPF